MPEILVKVLDTLISRDGVLIFFGAFAGAFVSYFFYKRGEKWRMQVDWNKKVKNQHAYLERYLNEVHNILFKNIFLYEHIENNLENKKVDYTSLNNFTIPEDITMKLKDLDFINNVFTFIVSLKTLDVDIDKFNFVKSDLSKRVLQYIEEYKIKSGDKEEESNFLQFLDEIAKDFMDENSLLYKGMKKLKKDSLKLMAENKVLIKKEKNIFKRIWFKVKSLCIKDYKKNKIEDELKKIREEMRRNFEKNKKELEDAGIPVQIQKYS